MTDMSRYEIFIATFIAPIYEKRLKPNRNQGLLPFTIPIDFSVCYENCENIVRFVNPQTCQEPLDFPFFRWQS